MKEYDPYLQRETAATIRSMPPTRTGISYRFVPGSAAFLIDPPRQVTTNPETRFMVGGSGVSGRTAAQLEQAMPGIGERLAAERGKIVFLGNGLSTVPVEVAEKGRKSEPPVVADVFDYPAILADFKDLMMALTEDGVDVTQVPFLLDRIRNALVINKGIADGTIKAVNYIVGSGNPPEELKDADLIVNCYGPSATTTLSEQWSLLKPTGELWMRDLDTGGPHIIRAPRE